MKDKNISIQDLNQLAFEIENMYKEFMKGISTLKAVGKQGVKRRLKRTLYSTKSKKVQGFGSNDYIKQRIFIV